MDSFSQWGKDRWLRDSGIKKVIFYNTSDAGGGVGAGGTVAWQTGPGPRQQGMAAVMVSQQTQQAVPPDAITQKPQAVPGPSQYLIFHFICIPSVIWLSYTIPGHWGIVGDEM